MKLGNAKLYDPLNSLFMEGYYELMLALALELVAFKRYKLNYFFYQINDQTNTIFAFAVLFYISFLSFKIMNINYKYAGKLSKNVK